MLKVHPLEGKEHKVANTIFKVDKGIVCSVNINDQTVPWEPAATTEEEFHQQVNRIYEMSW